MSVQGVKVVLAKRAAYKRARKLWQEYQTLTQIQDKVAANEKLSGFLSSTTDALKDLSAEDSQAREALEQIFGDCTAPLEQLLGLFDKKVLASKVGELGDQRRTAFADLIDKALTVAELIMRDPQYQNVVKQTPELLTQMVNILDVVDSTEAKRSILQMMMHFGNDANNRVMIGKAQGFNKMLKLLDSDEDLAKEVTKTLVHFLSVEEVRRLVEPAGRGRGGGAAAGGDEAGGGDGEGGASADGAGGLGEDGGYSIGGFALYSRNRFFEIAAGLTEVAVEEINRFFPEAKDAMEDKLAVVAEKLAEVREEADLAGGITGAQMVSTGAARLGGKNFPPSYEVLEQIYTDYAREKDKDQQEPEPPQRAESTAAVEPADSHEQPDEPDGEPVLPNVQGLPENQVQDLMRVQGVLGTLTESIKKAAGTVQLDMMDAISRLLVNNPQNQNAFRETGGYSVFLHMLDRVTDYSLKENQTFLTDVFDMIFTTALNGNADKSIGNDDAVRLLLDMARVATQPTVQVHAIRCLQDIMTVNFGNTAIIQKMGGGEALASLLLSFADTESPPAVLLDAIANALQYMIFILSPHNLEVYAHLVHSLASTILSKEPIAGTSKSTALHIVANVLLDMRARSIAVDLSALLIMAVDMLQHAACVKKTMVSPDIAQLMQPDEPTAPRPRDKPRESRPDTVLQLLEIVGIIVHGNTSLVRVLERTAGMDVLSSIVLSYGQVGLSATDAPDKPLAVRHLALWLLQDIVGYVAPVAAAQRAEGGAAAEEVAPATARYLVQLLQAALPAQVRRLSYEAVAECADRSSGSALDVKAELLRAKGIEVLLDLFMSTDADTSQLRDVCEERRGVLHALSAIVRGCETNKLHLMALLRQKRILQWMRDSSSQFQPQLPEFVALLEWCCVGPVEVVMSTLRTPPSVGLYAKGEARSTEAVEDDAKRDDGVTPVPDRPHLENAAQAQWAWEEEEEPVPPSPMGTNDAERDWIKPIELHVRSILQPRFLFPVPLPILRSYTYLALLVQREAKEDAEMSDGTITPRARSDSFSSLDRFSTSDLSSVTTEGDLRSLRSDSTGVAEAPPKASSKSRWWGGRRAQKKTQPSQEPSLSLTRQNGTTNWENNTGEPGGRLSPNVVLRDSFELGVLLEMVVLAGNDRDGLTCMAMLGSLARLLATSAAAQHSMCLAGGLHRLLQLATESLAEQPEAQCMALQLVAVLARHSADEQVMTELFKRARAASRSAHYQNQLLQVIAAAAERDDPRAYFQFSDSGAAVYSPPINRLPSDKNGYSLAFWVKPRALLKQSETVIFCWEDSKNVLMEIYFCSLPLDASSSGRGQMFTSSDTDAESIRWCLNVRLRQRQSDRTEVLTFEQYSFDNWSAWYHIVVTHNRQQLSLLVNGELIQSFPALTYPTVTSKSLRAILGSPKELETDESERGDLFPSSLEQNVDDAAIVASPIVVDRVTDSFCGYIGILLVTEGVWDVMEVRDSYHDAAVPTAHKLLLQMDPGAFPESTFRPAPTLSEQQDAVSAASDGQALNQSTGDEPDGAQEQDLLARAWEYQRECAREFERLRRHEVGAPFTPVPSKAFKRMLSAWREESVRISDPTANGGIVDDGATRMDLRDVITLSPPSHARTQLRPGLVGLAETDPSEPLNFDTGAVIHGHVAVLHTRSISQLSSPHYIFLPLTFLRLGPTQRVLGLRIFVSMLQHWEIVTDFTDYHGVDILLHLLRSGRAKMNGCFEELLKLLRSDILPVDVCMQLLVDVLLVDEAPGMATFGEQLKLLVSDLRACPDNVANWKSANGMSALVELLSRNWVEDALEDALAGLLSVMKMMFDFCFTDDDLSMVLDFITGITTKVAMDDDELSSPRRWKGTDDADDQDSDDDEPRTPGLFDRADDFGPVRGSSSGAHVRFAPEPTSDSSSEAQPRRTAGELYVYLPSDPADDALMLAQASRVTFDRPSMAPSSRDGESGFVDGFDTTYADAVRAVTLHPLSGAPDSRSSQELANVGNVSEQQRMMEVKVSTLLFLREYMIANADTATDLLRAVGGNQVILALLSMPDERIRLVALDLLGLMLKQGKQNDTKAFTASGGFETVGKLMVRYWLSRSAAAALLSLALGGGGTELSYDDWLQGCVSASVLDEDAANDSGEEDRADPGRVSSSSMERMSIHDPDPAEPQATGVVNLDALLLLMQLLQSASVDTPVVVEFAEQIFALLSSDSLNGLVSRLWVDWSFSFFLKANKSKGATRDVMVKLVHRINIQMVLRSISWLPSPKQMRLVRSVVRDCHNMNVRLLLDVISHLEDNPYLHPDDASQSVKNIALLFDRIEEQLDLGVESWLRVVNLINDLAVQNNAAAREAMKASRLFDIRDNLLIHCLKCECSLEAAYDLAAVSFDSLADSPRFRESNGVLYLLRLMRRAESDPALQVLFVRVLRHEIGGVEVNRKILSAIIKDPDVSAHLLGLHDDSDADGGPPAAPPPPPPPPPMAGGSHGGDREISPYRSRSNSVSPLRGRRPSSPGASSVASFCGDLGSLADGEDLELRACEDFIEWYAADEQSVGREAAERRITKQLAAVDKAQGKLLEKSTLAKEKAVRQAQLSLKKREQASLKVFSDAEAETRARMAASGARHVELLSVNRHERDERAREGRKSMREIPLLPKGA